MQFVEISMSIGLLVVLGLPGPALAKKTGKPAVLRLIPPPPPTIPVTGQLGQAAGYDVQFMSIADLKSRKTELIEDLNYARKQASEQQTRLKDKQDKAELFAGLYKEGVVSRRELEAVQEEALRFQQEGQDAQRKLDNMESELKRIEARLKLLSPSKARSPKEPGDPKLARDKNKPLPR